MPWLAFLGNITDILVDAIQKHQNNAFQVFLLYCFIEMNNEIIKIVRNVDSKAQ